MILSSRFLLLRMLTAWALILSQQTFRLGAVPAAPIGGVKESLHPRRLLSGIAMLPLAAAETSASFPLSGRDILEEGTSSPDPTLLLDLTRTPVTLTNGNQVLALSFFSDSNHN